VTTLALPGIHRQDSVLGPSSRQWTGVPAFIGYAAPAGGSPEALPLAAPQVELTLWPRFDTVFGMATGYLREAVRCFFANGGEVCHVVALRPGASHAAAHAAALEVLELVEAVDLVCAPDVVWRAGATASDPVSESESAAMILLQTAVAEHCERLGDRFALLDSLPALPVGEASSGGVLRQRAQRSSDAAALYYPWIRSSPGTDAVPPCGHVAGAIARLDRSDGPYRAPANVALEAAVSLQVDLGRGDLARLNEAGVNALRAVPGRGIRIWGARTISADAAWRYVNVRRFVIAIARWARDALAPHVFEPNDPSLWRRLGLAIEVRLEEQFRSGALAGATPGEAFYVRCDAETTGPAQRDAGQAVVEVGLAVARPNEFVVVHIVRDARGVSITPA
jgi:phage tail sheath protein FI